METGFGIVVVHDGITPSLKRLAAALENPGPAFRTIANVLDRSVKKNFRAEGRPQKWDALKPSTAGTVKSRSSSLKTRKVRTKRRGTAHILRDTGRLAQSIQTRSSRDFAEVGAPGVIAAVHQYGTNRAGRSHNVTIPKRTFIGASDKPQQSKFELVREDEQDVEKAIDGHIMKAARG